MRKIMLVAITTVLSISGAWAQSAPFDRQGVAWLPCPVGTPGYGKYALYDIRSCGSVKPSTPAKRKKR